MQTYFRLESGDRDPSYLLDPEEQTSEPWGGTVYGRCDKCGGDGRTEHECESCTAGDVDPDCPACGGRIHYMDECPACEGSGEIDDSSRDGVSVFPSAEGLYRYMSKRDVDLDGCVMVELAGEESKDEDFDADEGALLIRPERVVETHPLDGDKLAELRASVS